jgi:hypothetical protein
MWTNPGMLLDTFSTNEASKRHAYMTIWLVSAIMAIAVVPVLGLIKSAGPTARPDRGLRAELQGSLLAGFRGSASSGSASGLSSSSDAGDRGGNAGRPPELAVERHFERLQLPFPEELRLHFEGLGWPAVAASRKLKYSTNETWLVRFAAPLPFEAGPAVGGAVI